MTESAPHILIVESRFYDDIADELLKGAGAALDDAGATYDVITVDGAFEVPGAIAMAMEASREGSRLHYDGYVALGCVVRGETSHYDYVCGESARGLMDLSIQKHAAIGYGILTTETRDQAWARAAVDKGNKGRAAVSACLGMIDLRKCFQLA